MRPFSRAIIFLLASVFAAAPAASSLAAAPVIYVSPDGSDADPGTPDSPVRTLAAARDMARLNKTSGAMGSAKIVLRGGRHVLTETLVLGMSDAGMSFVAYGAEKPIVSSGIPVSGWKVHAENVWVADLPASLPRFHTLYDASGRLPRASSGPRFFAKAGDRRKFYYSGTAVKEFRNLSDVEIYVRPRYAWVANMLPLASVNESEKSATTVTSATYPLANLPGYVHAPDTGVYWIENAVEYLDEPGEWALDFNNRKLYLWPRDGGEPTGILAPSLTELIRVEGSIDYDGPADLPVRNIFFSGLTFSHADRWPWRSDSLRMGYGLQHDWEMFDRPTAALRFRGAEGCVVENCVFSNSGGTGLRIDLHGKRIVVHNNEFGHLGHAGILLAGYGLGTKNVNRKNTITNNHVHHVGEVIGCGIGILIWRSGENRIAHNRIEHTAYSGIAISDRVGAYDGPSPQAEGGMTVRYAELPDSARNVPWTYAGWRRAEPYLYARDNLVEYNEVTGTVEFLSDGNAIYVSGGGTGNVVRYNFIHDNMSGSFTEALRCDDFQHEVTIHGNVVFRNRGKSGIVSKGINTITNNFVVDLRPTGNLHGYISHEAYPVTGSVVKHNVLYSTKGGFRPQYAMAEGSYNTFDAGNLKTTIQDSNLYFSTAGGKWAGTHLSNMRSAGKEKGSRVGDPLFVDMARGDFGFRTGSPAMALGIEEIDASKAGIDPTMTGVTPSAVPPSTAPPLPRLLSASIRDGKLRLSGHTGPAELRLYSLSGRRIFSASLAAIPRSGVSLPRLAAGLYLLSVRQGGRSSTEFQTVLWAGVSGSSRNPCRL